MWVPVFFAAGIGVYFALPSEPPLWTAAAPFALLPLLWLFRRRPVVRGVVLLLLLATAGFADVQLKSFCLSRKAPPAEDGKLYLRGRIDRLDTNYRGRPRIVLGEMYDFEDNPVAGRYRLSMIHRDPGLEVGDCVEMVAAVSPPFPPSLADGYQFDRRLFFDGITGTGYIPSEVLPVKCPDSSPRLADRAAALRRSIVERIYNILPPDEAAVAVAIVAGDQTKISRPLIDAYRNSGLAHFLSISGLHMSMLAGLMFFLVRMVMALIPPLSLRYNSKKVAAVLAIFIGAVYLVISGAAIPAQRAFIMTLVVLLAVLFERQAISVRTLTWAALIVLVVTPEALVGASFQMSFAAVFALVAFYEKYAGRLNRFLSGEEVSLPLKIVGFGLSLTNRLTVWVASLPHATGGAVSMPVWALVLISLGGLWLCLWRGSWRIWGTAAVVVGMLAMAAVDKPDIIVDRQGKTMAVLNRSNGKYFFLPGASRWNKQNWLSKYAAEEEKNRRDIYNPLYPGRVEPVPGRGVLVDGRFFDRNETLGAGFYERDGHLRMETVRGYIGRRPWNR